MTAYLLTNHLLNFIAPALFVALCVVLAARRWPGGRSAARSSRMGWGRQFAIVALVNVLVLVAGLVFFSQDGKLLKLVTTLNKLLSIINLFPARWLPHVW